jgi:DNA mismatch endonuclease, patch repair protein
MVDRLNQAERSRNMSRIRGLNTRPELLLRSALHRAGFRFRLHPRELPGRPDIVFRKYSAVIFVHGCFWHRHPGCANATSPKTRPEFWAQKLNGNRRRDGRQIRSLLKAGWRVLVVWECVLDKPGVQATTAAQAGRWIRSESPYCEVPPGVKPLVGAIVH